MRSLYGRRFCIACRPYGSRVAQASRMPRTLRPRTVPGHHEWFFSLVNATLTLLSPQRAPALARTGVVAFSFSLLLPLFASGFVARPVPHAVVVAASEVTIRPASEFAAYELPPLPEPAARSRVVAAKPEPTPEPTPARVAAVPIAIAAVPAAPSGSVVTVSWYGPGFYENRLPCWQWLAANGLPIQFLPDTWGVAHKSLPCGTMVTLTHGANTVTVPVVDRGPYIAGREFDLSPRVKAALGCTDLCTVVMQIR
jgi:hypothetical protein